MKLYTWKEVDGVRRFYCTACGSAYNARYDASRCCAEAKQPVLQGEAGENNGLIPYYNRKSEILFIDDPRSGISHRDNYDHYRRGSKRTPEQMRANIHKWLGKATWDDKRRIAKELRSLFPCPHEWKESISPLQRLSYAFTRHNWEAVKQAAENYGLDRAVQRRLDELNIPDIIKTELRLKRVIIEMFHDDKLIEHHVTLADLQAFENRLEIEEFLDELEKGEEHGLEGI